MRVRCGLSSNAGPVPGRRALGAVLLVLAGVLGAPGLARAAVTFDRAFGVGVDTGTAVFENCTIASGCQAGISSDAAGGMSDPLGMAVDAQGRILLVDQGNHPQGRILVVDRINRVARFAVAGDGTRHGSRRASTCGSGRCSARR